MKTDQLIGMLSSNLEPVKSGQLKRTLALTLVAGGVAAFCVMLSTVGLRADGGGLHLEFLALKLLFMLILIGAGSALLTKLIRPGQDGRIPYLVILLVFIAIGLAGIVALAARPSAAWEHVILGTEWAMCAFCIPLFAVVPFVALIWALRRGAPTNLKRTGAIAGLVAGALGAVAYAFHCPDDSIPFIALWYGAMVALCAWIGAMLGPWLLRW
jgi:hypothetical protein